MDIVKGSVVRAKAGRDKGRFFVVLEIEGEYAFIADGKTRRAEKPKKKKLIHIQNTSRVLAENLETNRKIKEALRAFKFS